MEGGASLDAPLHIEIYRQNPATRAVFHSHGPHAVALTLNGEDFVPVDFEGQYYFPRVPVIRIPYEQYVDESPQAVAAQLQSHKLTIVCGHGIYACATSINLAYKWSCSLELSAKTAWLARQL
jgi:L-fuculose-phosphate aldolase